MYIVCVSVGVGGAAAHARTVFRSVDKFAAFALSFHILMDSNG